MIDNRKLMFYLESKISSTRFFYGCLMEIFGIKVYMQEIAGFFKSYTQNTMYISCLTNVFSFQSCKHSSGFNELFSGKTLYSSVFFHSKAHCTQEK